MKNYKVKAKSLCGVIFKGKLYNTNVEFEVVMNENELNFYKDYMEIIAKKEIKQEQERKATIEQKQVKKGD